MKIYRNIIKYSFLLIFLLIIIFIVFNKTRVYAYEMTKELSDLNGMSYKEASTQDFEIVAEGGTLSANRHGQEYEYNWYHTINSHLFASTDGTFTRVEFIDNEIVAETYNNKFVFQDKKTILLELSIYGGVYYSKDKNVYFVIEGEQNYDEKEKIPEFRIIKYDKKWNRLASVDITDVNTVEPFAGGACRFNECDGKLYIRTCHKIYKLEDGLNHQANITIQLDMNKCKIEAITEKVAFSPMGYAAHSFNQFIVNKNGIIYACDHSDAYPRSIVAFKCNSIESGKRAAEVNVFPFTGEIGDNYTGATLGGFAVTDSKAIIVGSSMPQDGSVTKSTICNIFISTVSTTDFSKNSLKTTWVTEFPQKNGKETVSNPQLISITDNRLLLMWETREIEKNVVTSDRGYTGKLQYVFLDGDGNLDGEIHSIYASLSDCEPIVFGNSLIWYVTGFNKKQSPVFYKLPLDRTLVTDVTLDKNALSLEVGDTMELTATINPLDAYNQNIIWSSSNKKVATVLNGKITAVGIGSAIITATTKDGDKQAFCEVTVIEKEKLGDVDNSGDIDVNDALIILKISASLITPTQAQEKTADVNGDNTIDSADALLVLKYAAGLITGFSNS